MLSFDMQERRNKRLAILFCALTCMTAIAFYLGKSDGSVEVNPSIFRDFDFKIVDQIVLESPKGRVELKFTGSKWKINNQFDADASMVEVLFATLQQAEPKRPLPSAVQDSVNTALKQQGTKVSVISSGQPVKTFYAGGNAQKTQSFFFIDSEDRTPYLVTIPGYRVYAAGIFELPEKEWRNKYVFGFNWRNFQRLEAEFPERSAENFRITLNDNAFLIDGLLAADTAQLNTFLDDVSLLTVDEYLDQDINADTVNNPSPVMIIKVKDIGQRVYTLEIFPTSKIHSPNIPGLINGTEWALFSPAKIRKIEKSRSFFAK